MVFLIFFLCICEPCFQNFEDGIKRAFVFKKTGKPALPALKPQNENPQKRKEES